MKIDLTLPETDIRARDHLRYVIFCHKFHNISIVDLCHKANLHYKQFQRAICGESSYRNQSYVGQRLVDALPWDVTEEKIQESLSLMDAIAEKLKEFDKLQENEKLQGGELNG
ncbi:hypothetical protein SIL04_10070 [Bacillus cereus group sp. BfR-BA-00331]|nr:MULTISPECIES: hypothetical protein [unclassified Bacillus cereus group]ONG70132.1 hypothetical protein BKK44_14020 [Bacillus cereus]MDA2192081.1 hypothetical protein [Bacillus cereus group sp. Bc238]MDA2197578.1 hypothetical protein [Bacillus cereus group sp. Bc237]MDA2756298.1 hypothetical protein [Bacillus cereus group sp. Bc007]MDA2761737.1 hypothetical protein [Bacillus cereus group sp. Bc008]